MAVNVEILRDVTRQRSHLLGEIFADGILAAADEIERLRAKVERLKVANGGLRASAEASIAERKRIASDLYDQGRMLTEATAERDAALAELLRLDNALGGDEVEILAALDSARALLTRHGLGGDA